MKKIAPSLHVRLDANRVHFGASSSAARSAGRP
jgi:hypothetical protein